MLSAVSIQSQQELCQACSWQHLQIIAHNNGRTQNSKRDPKGLRYGFGLFFSAVPQHGQLVSLWLHSGNKASTLCSMSKVKGRTALGVGPEQLGLCRTCSTNPNLNHYEINREFSLRSVTDDAVHWHWHYCTRVGSLSGYAYIFIRLVSQPHAIMSSCLACSVLITANAYVPNQ